jgi:hypothetical protein
MARREVSVGLAADVHRYAAEHRTRRLSGLCYVGGRWDYCNPFADGFYADLYEAFRECHTCGFDQRVFLGYLSGESLRRVAERLRIPVSTAQSAVDRTTERVLATPSFGWVTALYEDFEGDWHEITAVFD